MQWHTTCTPRAEGERYSPREGPGRLFSIASTRTYDPAHRDTRFLELSADKSCRLQDLGLWLAGLYVCLLAIEESLSHSRFYPCRSFSWQIQLIFSKHWITRTTISPMEASEVTTEGKYWVKTLSTTCSYPKSNSVKLGPAHQLVPVCMWISQLAHRNYTDGFALQYFSFHAGLFMHKTIFSKESAKLIIPIKPSH